jgi:hypothetical protein
MNEIRLRGYLQDPTHLPAGSQDPRTNHRIDRHPHNANASSAGGPEKGGGSHLRWRDGGLRRGGGDRGVGEEAGEEDRERS